MKRYFEVKLDSIDPTGTIIKRERLVMRIQEESRRVERLYIHIGDCLYHIDKHGNILDRVIPHELSRNFIKK